MGNIAWVLAALAAGWVLNLGLTWRQARRFSAAVSGLRRKGGRISVGMGRKKTLKSFVAIAVEDNTVVRALVLNGATVFATPRPEPRLVGKRLSALTAGTPIDGLSAQVVTATAQAAGFLTKDKAAMFASRP